MKSEVLPRCVAVALPRYRKARIEVPPSAHEYRFFGGEYDDEIGADLANLRLSGFTTARATAFRVDVTGEGKMLTGGILSPGRTYRSIHLDVLSAGEPLWVSGNPTYTEQAITNLVQNALSYGKEGGEVIVSLTSEDGTFELLVEDDGPGVAPEELPRLTERYFRAGDERSRQKPGSGLGLSIAQRVCERAGWKLVLAQAEPSGLAIRIRGRLASQLG